MRDVRTLLAIGLIALAGCGSTVGAGDASQPVVVDAVVGATAAGFHAAAYLRVEQQGGDDALVAITTDRATRVTLMGPNVTMTETAGASGFPVDLPAGEQVAFTPGGDHIMLEGVDTDLVAGEQVTLRMTFERSADIVVAADVVAPADLLDRTLNAEGG